MARIRREPRMRISRVRAGKRQNLIDASVYRLPKISPKGLAYTGLPDRIPRIKSVPRIFGESGARYKREVSGGFRRLV